MTIRKRKLDNLLTILDGATPNHAALDEAFTILAAQLRRQGRDGERVLYLLRRDDRRLVLDRDGSLAHHADRMGDSIAVVGRADATNHVVLGDEHRDRAADGAIAVAPGSVRDDDGFVETDGGFRWPWSEVAPALAAAIRAIPTPKPKAVLCDACKKEFYR